MRKLFISIIVGMVTGLSFGQTVDRFTKQVISETKQINIIENPFSLATEIMQMKTSLKRIDDKQALRIEIVAKGQLFFREGNSILFKMIDGSVLDLKFMTAEHTQKRCYDCAAYDAVVFLHLSDADIEVLKQNQIDEVRIYTSEGYVEAKGHKKRTITFMKSL